MANINPIVLKKAEALKSQIQIDDNGVASLPKDAFITTLDNQTPEQVKAAFAERDTYVAASIHTLGEAGLAHLAKNKNVAQVSLATTVLNDSVNAVLHRERVSRNPTNGEAIHTKGAVSVNYKAVAAKTNSGSTGAVVAAIKINAVNELAD